VGCFYFVFAMLAVVRLAVAETFFREDTIGAVTAAVDVMSDASAAEFEQRLAEIDPARAQEYLERALSLNPRASSAWISLGLLQEDAGLSDAERSLLEAAKVDHLYLPAWTLSNFYFRRGNREKFWMWAPRAAALTYDDFRPLLRLCNELESEPGKTLAHFGRNDRLRTEYLNFLIGENRLDAAQVVAKMLTTDRANDPHLIDLADRQLRAGNATAALELWNVASGFPAIDPANGRILTNGDLSRPPLNLGFDWRMGQSPGIFRDWRPSELIFNLSGEQPERCVLIEQTIYLSSAQLKLVFDYITGPVPPVGLHWSLNKIEGPQINPSKQWTKGGFRLPRAPGVANLRLFYRREPGTTRTEGRIEFRNLRLEVSR
jgi:tetratricopeptide (TPR) repeat protein